MPQNTEAVAFLSRVVQLPPGPGVSLDDVLKPSLVDEAQLRKLFAQDKNNSRLNDPYVGLVDVFDAPEDIRKTRARVVRGEEDTDAKYVMPLPEDRRRNEGAPAMVDNLEEFKRNWAIFTEGSLSQLLNWNNVVVAGGAVQACLAPVPESAKASKRTLRKYFHSRAFPTSDVDVFMYGLTPEQAEIKMNAIFEAVRDSIPWDVTCIRTKHTVSIHSQYPYRAVQIVLRLYQSPAEILAGFDVDAPCCCFDGERVYASPRAIVAMMRQCNTVDVTRRSPSYEVRLSKYSSRDFEVYVPELNRADIDPTIFERSIVRIQGLARLLVLEKLSSATSREKYLQSRRQVRGRPEIYDDWRRMMKKKYRGDLKGDEEGLEMSDYDVISLHIPYGPGWDAKRIEKLVYTTDLGMNSPFNPKNKDRRLHRHAAFFGTMQECLEDCCEYCPEPKDDEERELHEKEAETYVRGRVEFIVEDPGRQSISGSFNPVDEGEWSEQAYMGVIETFFHAIASHNREVVAAAIKDGIDVNRRDHVGRTPLQIAILSKATDIACDLIDAGARMTSRLVDGRTALHLSAQLNLPIIARKLLEKSALNAEEAKVQEEEAKRSKGKDDEDDAMDTDLNDDEEIQDSSEDDWSSDDDDEGGKKKDDAQGNPADGGMIPEDEEDVPDVFDVDVPDWDYALSSLDYAIIAGSVPVVDLLLAANANPKLVTVPHSVGYVHPLILTAAAEDEDVACKTAEKLIAAGAVTSEADDKLFTILHRSVLAGRPKLLAAMLRSDPNAKAVTGIPWMDDWSAVMFPISSAVCGGSYASLAILLAYGAKVTITEDDFQRARDMKLRNNGRAPAKFLDSCVSPIEAAVARFDEVVYLLAALGADVNAFTRNQIWGVGKDFRITLLDFTRAVKATQKLSMDDHEDTPSPEQDLPEWKTEATRIALKHEELEREKAGNQTHGIDPNFDDAQDYMARIEELLLSHQGKSAADLSPDEGVSNEDRGKAAQELLGCHRSRPHKTNYGMARPYNFRRHEHHEGQGMRADLASQYDELFAACWSGDNAKIQRLCLPSSGPKKELLQISCQWGDAWKGFTPLSVAIAARRWETAKVILAVATAQHNPEEVESRATFSTRDLALDDDDSDDSDDGCCDVDEDECMDDDKKDISLVDIANAPSEVRVKVGPAYMLNNVSTPTVSKDGKTSEFAIPIVKAINDDDFEAFIQILEMYNSLPGNEQPNALAHLITKDRPAMLDEYIRRTGQGVDFTTKEDSPTVDAEDHDDIAQELEANKIYLGLNVHGRKRKDLAAKGDPNAPRTYDNSDEMPMLWQAAQRGSLGVLRYLASDQPVAAYRFYASSHGDAHAKLLKKIPDLAAVLPAKLGWTSNRFNENVATAAIRGRHTDVLEALLSLSGKDVEPMLHSKHRGYGFNSLLAAARWGVPIPMFDFLLSKGVSPVETDHRGWNILHLLCARGDGDGMKLLQHVLKHLPKEIVERLLRQQTKELRATPLHVAVKKTRTDIVELLVTLPHAPVQQHTIREVGGSTPLQLAVSSRFANITRLLIAHGPTEVLNLENSVGNTPLEIATRQTFEGRLDTACGNIQVPPLLQIEFNTRVFDVEKVEKELEQLNVAIADLSAEGRLTAGTKLDRELRSFAKHLEGRLAEWKKREEGERKPEEEKHATDKTEDEFTPLTDDCTSPSEVLKLLQDALTANPMSRRLVHLSDVHESVRATLAKFNEEQKAIVDRVAAVTKRADDEEKTEQDKKGTSMTDGWDDAYRSYDARWITV